jgi:hypothetical protein
VDCPIAEAVRIEGCDRAIDDEFHSYVDMTASAEKLEKATIAVR